MNSKNLKLLKLKNAMEKLDTIKEKQKTPLYEIREMESILNNIALNGKDITIINNVKEFFIKHYFTVKTKGIGWVISY